METTSKPSRRGQPWCGSARRSSASGHIRNNRRTAGVILGGYITSRELAGNPHGVDDTEIPNITPDEKTGLGEWSESDIADYLETGMTPEGDFAGDAMAEVIDNSTSHLTKDDRRAIAIFLKSLPAVETQKQAHDRQGTITNSSARIKSCTGYAPMGAYPARKIGALQASIPAMIKIEARRTALH